MENRGCVAEFPKKLFQPYGKMEPSNLYKYQVRGRGTLTAIKKQTLGEGREPASPQCYRPSFLTLNGR